MVDTSPKKILKEPQNEERKFDDWIKEYIDTFRHLDRWDTPKFTEHAIYTHLKPLDEEAQLRFFRAVLSWVEQSKGLNAVVNKVVNVFTHNPSELDRTEESVMRLLLTFLLRRSLPLTADDLRRTVKVLTNEKEGICWDVPLGSMITHGERLVSDSGLEDPLRKTLSMIRHYLLKHDYYSDFRKNLLRVEKLLGLVEAVKVDTGEPWAEAMVASIETLNSKERANFDAWLEHCQQANASKPSKKWMKTAMALVDKIGKEKLADEVTGWLTKLDKKRTDRPARSVWFGEPVWWDTHISEDNATLLRGIVWTFGALDYEPAPQVLRELAIQMYRKIPGLGPRNVKVGNAAIQALTTIGMSGVNQLALIRMRTTHKSVLKTIDKALQQAAKNAGMTMDQLEDMSVPSYGMQSPGYGEFEIDGYIARLQCESGSKVRVTWLNGDKVQKTVPKAVKESFPDELREVKAASKDIQSMLPAQKARIESAYLKDRRWSRDDWLNYYHNHPLVGFLARRLIWQVAQDDATHTVLWHDGAIRDVTGNEVTLDGSACISLWHPLMAGTDEVLAWRRRLEDLQIRQPFKQAHREIYVLTDAEQATGTYSNRFAAHVLKQHQFNALAGARGWSYQLQGAWDGGDSIASIDVPAWKLSAEFWVEGIGEYGNDTSESGVFLYVTTDQVRFYARPEAHGGMTGARLDDGPMSLDEIPALVFSEILRDVDLFVGVASVGNDPEWADGGPEGRFRYYWASYSFGELNATAKTRKEQLERLVPRLKIASVAEVEDRFLVVHGKLRTYRIHLGSGNIQMEPNNQYLCIVQGRGKASNDKDVFLPFEGDQMLSVILSKALLLADDHKITDKSITNQINQR